MIINVPDGGPSHVSDRNGTIYMSKIVEGRLVIDVPLDVFRVLIKSEQGQRWETANAGGDVWRYFEEGARAS